MKTLLLSVALPFELTNGNEGRTKTWYRPAQIRMRFEYQLKLLGLTRSPFPQPVNVLVTRLLGKSQRLWDSSSIGRGNYKELEDALVAVGWFHNDSPKWIQNTHFQQKKSSDDKPAILIEVFSTGETDDI